MLVYVPPADAGIGKEVVWISRDGKAVDAFDTRSTWTQPRISPDGKRILLRKSLINCELWLYDITRGTLIRITQNADNHDAIWSPDSRSIAFLQASAGGHMVVQSVDGARTLTTVDTGEAQGHPQCWSAAGNRLFYTTQGHGTQTDIWSIVMDGPSKPEPLVNGPFDESVPAISPDGRYIAYVTNEFGSNEVVVRQVPDNGQSWQVSVGGGRSPLWSRGGSELYFVSDSKMMAVGVDTSAGFSAGQPRVLFDGGFDYDRPRYFDVDENGRFVAVRSPGGVGGMRQTRVLLNWPAEVKRLEGAAH
jgi:serine/threonine-protein kinase